ncbi:hypothetical protein GXW82_24095 [Streptacidiphilus sp. 4-A2]|nr:hypothetical protein [Streptacidiphilus sp. 4-A2]
MNDNGRMRYGILGTTQALQDDGTPVPVGGRACVRCWRRWHCGPDGRWPPGC